jgi:hypothetical protein
MCLGLALLVLAPTCVGGAANAPAPALPAETLRWPAVTREARPWTRWWWLGSAVDQENLVRQLTQFREVGLGGVEICPIYGAQGYEERFLPFLSPRWMDMLAVTTLEAQRLGLGVDLTTGTGWPFGGPQVTAEDASSALALVKHALAGGASLAERLPEGRAQCVLAISRSGERLDLTDKVGPDGRLDWTAPPGEWQIYATFQRGSIQKVKRAAPGGEGWVLDPYSVPALERYLAAFESAFAGYRGASPRAHFHDSFEYYGASWTPGFLREFERRRGYDLRVQLPALAGDGPEETVARVKSDFRETLSDLHLDYVRRWTAWCHGQRGLSRNQAHGAPGNLVDLYAAADIPENEVFRNADDALLPRLKLSSSAAHLGGRTLASSEAFTWLGEHFQVSLAQAKQAADLLFLSGANHLFFHGIPYSPAEAPWPGWQFYASVNMGPQGGLWRDLPAFNAYLTRCQSILQDGNADEDVLLYYPVHDVWHSAGDLIIQNPLPDSYVAAGLALWSRGYTFDTVSDRLLETARCEGGRLWIGTSAYRTVLVPHTHRMPVGTLATLVRLAREGATILIEDALPEDLPGLGNLEARAATLREILASLRLEGDTQAPLRRATLGPGRVVVGRDREALLREAGVSREPMADVGLRFVRRAHARGRHYFIANRGREGVDAWIVLGTPACTAVWLDPLYDGHAGLAELRVRRDGASEVYVQLRPGESRVLRTFTRETVSGPAWPDVQKAGQPIPVTGTWHVRFLDGGPVPPATFDTQALGSWTDRPDAEAQRFAGTAIYSLDLERPKGDAADWLLDLGDVRESARVRLNGEAVATLFTPPFELAIGRWLRPGENLLEIEVTNLATNRVRDLDLRQVRWKYFHDINVVNLSYEPLDASSWPLRASGLLGPVTLRPVTWRQAARRGGLCAAPRGPVHHRRGQARHEEARP